METRSTSNQENSIHQNIAFTILEQLGGHRFKLMTNYKAAYAITNGLAIQLSFQKGKVAQVRVYLNPNDTYEMCTYIMGKMVTDSPILLNSRNHLYFYELKEAFRDLTGLSCTL